ncbi:uncharacterized protein BDZ99DRAFT_313074 [Mytilinidion resinicola]|uniref:C3H1-type domain-containing protein n=1 Tax=Mytilinidion resinicola TaxID=574789 RepID=A0A6A6YP10_9PEZI|nr:uncharacterized protein BDZ99DRAFT_313074 [Mytilinidion resinicola]KAF2810481.1 hypothetical protein BDZ99DRAFT_313074 [Mytilinidion resinicola]
MKTVDVAEEFADRIKAIRDADNERFEWMNTFHTQIAELSEKYENISKDLKREQIAGRITQADAEKWQHQFEELQQSVHDGSFVLVLIDADADAYIFKDSYYQSPDGGRKAAVDLQTRVQEYLRKAKPALAGLPIMIKAFANSDGLSKLLVNVNIIQSSGFLWDFAKSFSQAHAMSDFVLVGNGKDRADEKVKGVFEQFVKNPTCRHIVFGACHDNGYVRVLEKHAGDSAVAERVTLLHSFDIGREFYTLSFQSTRMEDIFRAEYVQGFGAVASVGHQAVPEEETNGTATTWAALARVTESTDKKDLSTKIRDAQTVLVNAAGQRVDVKPAQPSKAALESWNHKVNVLRLRFCRPYHLLGGCNGKCNYSHGPLTKDEKLVLRRYIRGEPCHVGPKCREAKCYYGHNCSCQKQKCQFSTEMHRVDESTAEVWTGKRRGCGVVDLV